MSDRRARAAAPRDLWTEFLGPASDPSHCGLCGNSGVVDTRGQIRTAAGFECGVRAWCICPNGRVMKRGAKGHAP